MKPDGSGCSDVHEDSKLTFNHSVAVRDTAPRTIVQKILDAHRVHAEGGRSLIYVDRLIIADTAQPAFKMLKAGNYTVRKPKQVMLIPDHYTASTAESLDAVIDEERRTLVRDTEADARRMGMHVFGLGDPRRGIQHITSAEQGIAQPGVTIVAADSHTSTQSALGALAFSIGTDLSHVLATQCTWIKTPGMMRVNLEGHLPPGVTAKDAALALMAKVGARGATGLAVEFAGSFIRDLSIEGRMTICNMSAEMGARLGIIAPDDKVFDYLRGRAFAPSEEHWEEALAHWKTLASDPDAVFDREVILDVSAIEPMVTWGTSPENAVSINGVVPDPAEESSPQRRANMIESLDYMGLVPGTLMRDIAIDQVFIGSCTNSRIEDMRAAANVLRGRKVKIPTLIVPGSGLVKAQAEAEGLVDIFLSAGASWGEAGCSMCCSMNGDSVGEGLRCASTSNRSHMGRQGRGSRTHLVSPPMAAAAALTGRLTDCRGMEGF